jgi:hypothetical protein
MEYYGIVYSALPDELIYLSLIFIDYLGNHSNYL